MIKMKFKSSIKVLSLVCMLAILGACNDDDDNGTTSPLVGTWELTAQLADPGDGSGTFSTVSSEKRITFYADGNFICNGNICDMSSSTGPPTTGTYDAVAGTLQSEACSGATVPYPFVLEGGSLIISYPCFEPCRSKYEKK